MTYKSDWKDRKASGAALAKFEQQFAKDMGIDLATDSGALDAYTVTSTGSLNLDYALTIGGLPTGRIGEIWGPEHAGKTTLCILIAAQYQKAFPDKKVAWVDMEQTFDPTWATKLGLDVKALWRPPVKTAEDTADATKRFVESGMCSLVIVDSIGSMIAKKEMEKEADEQTVGLVAKIVTRMVKQISPMAKHNNTTVIVVNQVRAVIGGYGPSEDTAGGWALKHVSSFKMQAKRAGGTLPHTIQMDGKPVPVGYQMAVKIQKNKMGPMGQTALIWLHNVETDKYGPVGVDVAQETFDFAKRFGLMGSKAGGRYWMPGTEQEIVGEPKVLEHFRSPEGEKDRLALREQVLATLAGKIVDEGEPDDDPLGIATSIEGA